MNPLLLYLLLLKATLTSFSGLTSLPVVRNDLVVERRVLTDRDLNAAVAVARMTPGPAGAYIVCVGYQAGGVPGAMAGFAAMITPAFLIVAMVRWVVRLGANPALLRVTRSITLATAGLMLAATFPLARDALHTPFAWVLAAASFAVLAFTRLDTVWVILASGLAGLLTPF